MAQPAYLNQMLLLETDLSPRALLEICRAIELRRTGCGTPVGAANPGY
jgi:7,8-dihydro-6-hydroxymethylpterin-pyrophosphokinase